MYSSWENAQTEALFADIGHFTVQSIQVSMCTITYPALILAYTRQASFVTPPPLFGQLMGARHYVELGLFNLYLPFSQIKKNIYIYIISTTVVVFMFYTLSPITSQYTKLIPIPKIQRLRKQCGEHLSLSWPALLMWDVLSSIFVFCFCTYTD